jgi:hypothetical protein
MLIGNESEHVELVELERLPAHLPTPGDVRVKATVTLQQFSGTYSEVWFEQPVLVAFMEQLKALVESRKGTAKLESMGPDEFALELRSMETPGDYEASVRLGRYQYSGPTYWLTTISGGLEIDPKQLPSVLAGFQAMIDPREAN